jgi:hypothetical protein
MRQIIEIESIDFMISHFESLIAKFPRKMMTFGSNGLISINSKGEILQRCRKGIIKNVS